MSNCLARLDSSKHEILKKTVGILQFGDGNFLRGHIDWIVYSLNLKRNLGVGIAVISPLRQGGKPSKLIQQDGLYTLYTKGICEGKTIDEQCIVDVLQDFVDPYLEYDKFLEYAKSEQIHTIVSNTTEAGIVFSASDTNWQVCPLTYPGKLLAFLHARYTHLGDRGGLNIVPCELIDHNGDTLRKVLLQLCSAKGLDQKFEKWLNERNNFVNNLVDRIVPGFPKECFELDVKNGYVDSCAVVAEPFSLWVLQKTGELESKLPLHDIGCNVHFVDDIKPYKEMKVKLLNGSHTAMCLVGYLYGLETVKDCMDDQVVCKFVSQLIEHEILQTIDLPTDQKVTFANSVLERFKNPYIRHELMSISLNSTTKFSTRLLPTIVEYMRVNSELPQRLCFVLACLIQFYKGKRGDQDIDLKDEAEYLSQYKSTSLAFKNDLQACTQKHLSWLSEIWGFDLSGLCSTVCDYLVDFEKIGVKGALKKIVD